MWMKIASLLLSDARNHSEKVGTTFYRAPEQEGVISPMKGSNKTDCSSYGVKADIYSLGIVIFEMYHPKFGTYMERSETLNRLISGKPGERFPEAFTKHAPKNAEDLIKWCLERDPAKRPSAQELLKVSTCVDSRRLWASSCKLCSSCCYLY